MAANPLTFAGGAKTSEHKPRYDLVPAVLLAAVAARFEAGARKYGEYNYQRSLSDPTFLRERANHAMDHLQKYLHADWSEDSEAECLAAVGWGVAVLLEALRQGYSMHEGVQSGFIPYVPTRKL